MPNLVAVGTFTIQADGAQQVWYIDHDEPDTDYYVFMTPQNVPRDANGNIIAWEMGNKGTSGWHLIFSSPPPAPSPAFKVDWIVVRES